MTRETRIALRESVVAYLLQRRTESQARADAIDVELAQATTAKAALNARIDALRAEKAQMLDVIAEADAMIAKQPDAAV